MKRIICHGDSLTEGADIETSKRWPSLLQSALHIEVINSGIGGDSTAGMLSRFPSEVLKPKPDAVILMGGTNDFWWDLPINIPIANLYTMAYQAQYYGILPLFGLPIPFLPSKAAEQADSPPETGFNKLFAQLKLFVTRLKTSAEQSDIPVLDFYHLFVNKDASIRSDSFLEDGVHPNHQGHQRMAELAISKIKSLRIKS